MDKIGQVPDRYLSDEQRLMRQTCRRYVDEVVRPFIAANREREWLFDPDQRLPAELLDEADRTGLRGLGVPEQYGGVGLDPGTQAQTFSIIATEIARGDSDLEEQRIGGVDLLGLEENADGVGYAFRRLHVLQLAVVDVREQDVGDAILGHREVGLSDGEDGRGRTLQTAAHHGQGHDGHNGNTDGKGDADRP